MRRTLFGIGCRVSSERRSYGTDGTSTLRKHKQATQVLHSEADRALPFVSRHF